MDEQTSTGLSFSSDPEKAAKEAVYSAIAKLNAKPKFGFLFCSNKYSIEDIKILVHSAHKIFREANPNFEWVGCTTPHVKGCAVLVTASKNMHASIGIGNYASKQPKLAGENATKEAFSKIPLDEHILSYISSLAVEENHPLDLDKIHPFLLTMLVPHTSQPKEVLKGLASVAGSRAPVFKGYGHTFSNGVVFKDAAIILLQAFDKANDWHSAQKKWFSSILGHPLLDIK